MTDFSQMSDKEFKRYLRNDAILSVAMFVLFGVIGYFILSIPTPL